LVAPIIVVAEELFVIVPEMLFPELVDAIPASPPPVPLMVMGVEIVIPATFRFTREALPLDCAPWMVIRDPVEPVMFPWRFRVRLSVAVESINFKLTLDEREMLPLKTRAVVESVCRV
jgi:hypothetical protein